MSDDVEHPPEESEMAASCVALSLMISTSGGYAGIGAQQDKVIELDLLPEAQRAAVDSFLDEVDAEKVELTTDRSPDELVYEFELFDCGEKVKSFRLRESALSPERLDMLDELIHGNEDQ